jgi:methyl-accepting chemotaxis protein
LEVSIAAKIYFVIFFPTLALIGLASWIMLDRRAEVVEASVTLSAQAALRAATGLVADLQLERGRSAQFIAAKGEKFLDELTQQRAKVDSALASLDVALNPDVLA